MILDIGWAMVQAVTFKKNECNKNKNLVQCIDPLEVEAVHEITERSKDQNILLIFYLLSLYDCFMMNIL